MEKGDKNGGGGLVPERTIPLTTKSEPLVSLIELMPAPRASQSSAAYGAYVLASGLLKNTPCSLDWEPEVLKLSTFEATRGGSRF